MRSKDIVVVKTNFGSRVLIHAIPRYCLWKILNDTIPTKSNVYEKGDGY